MTEILNLAYDSRNLACDSRNYQNLLSSSTSSTAEFLFQCSVMLSQGSYMSGTCQGKYMYFKYRCLYFWNADISIWFEISEFELQMTEF